MNDLLNDVMHERADVLGPPSLDVAGIVAAGDRQVRRRRAAMFGGGLAAVVALGAVTPSLLRLAEGPVATVETNSFAAAFAASSPTYAVGRTVHIAGQEFTVSKPIRAFVQTDLGIVYADADGVVRSHDGISESDPLGTAVFTADRIALVADGTSAAWIEEGPAPRVAVFDQLGQGVARVDLEPASDNEHLNLEVLAADGATVYVRDGRGVVEIADGVASALPTHVGGDRVEVGDVQAGMFAYATVTDGVEAALLVGPSLTERSFRVPGYPNTSLSSFSPDGTWLSVEVEDGVPALYSTATGEERALPVNDYPFQVNFGWVDDDTYAAVALEEVDETGAEPEGGWTFDLLTCSVSASECEVSETEMKVDDGFTLPIGVDLASD